MEFNSPTQGCFKARGRDASQLVGMSRLSRAGVHVREAGALARDATGFRGKEKNWGE